MGLSDTIAVPVPEKEKKGSDVMLDEDPIAYGIPFNPVDRPDGICEFCRSDEDVREWEMSDSGPNAYQKWLICDACMLIEYSDSVYLDQVEEYINEL